MCLKLRHIKIQYNKYKARGRVRAGAAPLVALAVSFMKKASYSRSDTPAACLLECLYDASHVFT